MKKAIVFIIYAILMLSMGLTLISCKKESVKPSVTNNNNNNNNNGNAPLKHSMVVDSAYTVNGYFVADTNSLHMYYDPATNYNIHIHADGIHGGSLDIYLSKAGVINGVLPTGSYNLNTTDQYAIYTSPQGKVYSTKNSYSNSTFSPYPETDNKNVYCGFSLMLGDTNHNPIKLQCQHAYIKIQ